MKRFLMRFDDQFHACIALFDLRHQHFLLIWKDVDRVSFLVGNK